MTPLTRNLTGNAGGPADPAGLITAEAVWRFGWGWLALGWCCCG